MLQELHLGLPGGFEKVINYASHRRIDEIRETWKIRLSTMAAVSGRRHRLVIKNNYIVVIISILLQLELVCIDLLTIEQHKEGHQTCIVITDHLARYAQARPARNQTTAQIAFSPTFFFICSDQAVNFTSNFIKKQNISGIPRHSESCSRHCTCQNTSKTIIASKIQIKY